MQKYPESETLNWYSETFVMALAPTTVTVLPEEYLQGEHSSDVKHEYDNGYVFSMIDLQQYFLVAWILHHRSGSSWNWTLHNGWGPNHTDAIRRWRYSWIFIHRTVDTCEGYLCRCSGENILRVIEVWPVLGIDKLSFLGCISLAICFLQCYCIFPGRKGAHSKHPIILSWNQVATKIEKIIHSSVYT